MQYILDVLCLGILGLGSFSSIYYLSLVIVGIVTDIWMPSRPREMRLACLEGVRPW